MYFEISSSGANGDLYTIRTGAEQRENTFITIVSTHYWLKARTDSIGEAHLIIYTASNKLSMLLFQQGNKYIFLQLYRQIMHIRLSEYHRPEYHRPEYRFLIGSHLICG